jgi:succinyl-diaminopimelate desuccinylase
VLDDYVHGVDARCPSKLAHLGELLLVVGSGRENGKDHAAFEVREVPGSLHAGNYARRSRRIRDVESLAHRTLELVNIASESRGEEAAIEYVRAAMPTAPVYDDDTVLFWPGRVVLAGHVDTVPAQDNWPGSLDGGWVVGLGASDMKGGCAVMLELARAGAPFGFLFFGREELPAGESALPQFFERHGLDCELVVMMEPTDNEIHAGCLGNLNARVVFRGESAHSARPWTGVNAISLAIDGLAPLAHVEPRDVAIQGLVFREVVSITGISGGIATNVVPPEATAVLNFRYAPDRDAAGAEEFLRTLVGDGGDLELAGNSPPGRVAAESPLVRALRDVGDFAVAPKQAWTPVAEFSAQGLDAINFGPGATRYAHRQDERVAIAELQRSYDALLRFAATVSA